jgi:hypothetical protein
MRDTIACALTWVLRLLLPARGRHSAGHVLAHQAPPPQSAYVICGPTRPIPAHVLARTLPIPESTRPLVPLYLMAWEREQGFERRQQRERRRAGVAASMGYDYPYSYPGAHTATAAV